MFLSYGSQSSPRVAKTCSGWMDPGGVREQRGSM
jgi:hypothetical protein